jgi:ZF-HD class homeobox domain-containing protein
MALHHKSDLMELRGQGKEILGTPTALSYNLSHKVSSTKLSSSTVGERRDQIPALDHHQQYHHHHPTPPPPPPQQSNPYTHQNTDKPTRDPDPNPDPVPASGATSTPIIVRQPPQTIRAAPKVRYRECLKNHAASKGGHVVDGCGEFMSSGEDGTPEALICAACECHRNFHRKEVEGDHQYVSNYHYVNPNRNNIIGLGDQIVPPHQQHPHPPHLLHHHQHHHKFPSTSPSAGHIAPMMMAFGSGGGAPAEYSSSEDLNMFRSNIGVQTSAQAPESKKRFRTRFSREQKDKMMEFAEKLGWKIQKHDEQQVHQFCSEVGVKKQVFKVWMHNNKQAMKNKQM